MKIMIVEDEKNIREGLAEMIDWEKEGFEKPVLFPGAVEALEYLESRSVDIVITDLYMPLMSGIEFIRMARERNYRCEVIILTGHERFDLAQQAIELGVKRYLLKPVERERLLSVLCSVSREITERMKLRDWASISRTKIQEYLPVIQNQFWNDIISGRLGEVEAVKKRARDAEISLPDAEMACIAMRRRDQAGFDTVIDEVALKQLTQEILGEKYVYAFPLDGVQLVICKGRIARADIEILEESVRQNFGFHTIYGISHFKTGISHVRTLAGQAVDAVYSVNAKEKIFYLFYRDIEKKRRMDIEYPYHEERELMYKIRLQKRPGQQEIDHFMSKIMPPNYSPEQSKMLLLQFLCELARLANEIGVDILHEFKEAESAIYKYENVRKHFTDMIAKLIAEKNKMSVGYTEVIVQTAIRYMEENFREPELSVSRIAEAVGITSNYLSRIFREATGQTCISYLTTLRMEEAKKLLTRSQEKTYLIAERTGYQNPNYFSAIFKKYTGYTPKEFREGAGHESPI